MSSALTVPEVLRRRGQGNRLRLSLAAGLTFSFLLLYQAVFFPSLRVPLILAVIGTLLVSTLAVSGVVPAGFRFYTCLAFAVLNACLSAGWLMPPWSESSLLLRWCLTSGLVTALAVLLLLGSRAFHRAMASAAQERLRGDRLQAELAISEERLRLLLAGRNDAMYDWNPVTQTGFFSPRLYEFLGYSPGDVAQTSGEWLDHVHPDDRMRLAGEWMETVLGEPSEYDRQYLLRTRSGNFLCVHDHGRVISRDDNGRATRIIGTLTDITRVRQTEDALHDSEARYRDLVENANDFIFNCDAEGRFAAVNGTMVRWLGYSKEQFLQMSLFDLFLPEFASELQLHLRQALDGHAREPLQAALTSLCGHRFWIGLNSRPIAGRNGSPIGVQCIGRNITEQRDLEEQLRQSQKMEALGRLAGGVAHDFNNLLTVINGFSEMAIGRLDQDDELVDDLEEIRKAGDRAAGLTRQLLAFSRKQIAQPRIVDINEIVNGLSKMLSRVVRENVAIELLLSPAPVPVRIDAGHLEQVIMNLAANARDAMSNGGRLILRTSALIVQAHGPLFRRGIPDGEYCCLEVADTGIGMDEKVQAHIFDPFFTTKAPGIGTGLGLSTVYGIVQQARGYILVDSQPGHGATFRVYLPVATEPAGHFVPRQTSPPLSGEGVILLVEDYQPLRDFLISTLQGCGYKVVGAGNADEALKLAGTHAAGIDLLISDVILCGMSGTELARKLQLLRPQLKVLYMSGYTTNLGDETTFDPELNYLQKPFSAETLGLRVRRLLTPADSSLTSQKGVMRAAAAHHVDENATRQLAAFDAALLKPRHPDKPRFPVQ